MSKQQAQQAAIAQLSAALAACAAVGIVVCHQDDHNDYHVCRTALAATAGGTLVGTGETVVMLSDDGHYDSDEISWGN